MSASLLDGNKIASEIRGEVAAEVRTMTAAGVRPGLAVVLVGHNPASEIYVRGKVKASEEVGIHSEQLTPPENISTHALLDMVRELNGRDGIDGILVQLPLPAQVDAKKILLAVDPAKDVDGFHPMNVGFLSTQRPGLVPCTPAGIMEIRRTGGGGGWAQRHRRQADGDAAHQRQRHGDGVPFEDARSAGRLPPRGHSCRGDRARRHDHAGVREAGRDRD
jgi:hypothetical protein